MTGRNIRRILLMSLALSAAPVVCPTPTNAGMLYTDGMGDTFGSGSPVFDIASASSDLTTIPGSVVFEITFFSPSPIVAPSSGSSDALVGFVDIDVDQNPATGDPLSHLDLFGQGVPSPGLGVDFFVDLGSELFFPGEVEVVDVSTGLSVVSVPITYDLTSISFAIPLIFLSVAGDLSDEVEFGVIVGNFNASRDQVTFPGSNVVPEPGSLGIFALGIACTLCRCRRGRAQRRSAGM